MRNIAAALIGASILAYDCARIIHDKEDYNGSTSLRLMFAIAFVFAVT